MDLGTVFKLSLYGLTALVGAILGAAEGEGAPMGSVRGDLVLPFLSLPVVVCGYLFTERKSRGSSKARRGLSSVWANVLGIIALIATAQEFMGENREGKLLAGTHLLLYATWIVLFQQKTVRLYWFLMALGILQLAVASVLTTKGWFGFCAVAYMFGAVWTLSIFSLWRAEQLFADEDRARSTRKGIESLDWEPTSPLPINIASEVRGTVQHESGTRWLSVRFVTGVLMTTFSALLVSAAFFAFIPRVWVGPEITFHDNGPTAPRISRKTGLATSVRLGDFGSALESMERVFDFQVNNFKTKQPISVQSYAELLGLAEPLFRGVVMVRYENGRWSPDDSVRAPVSSFRVVRASPKDLGAQEEIRMAPNASDVLYFLGAPLVIVDKQHRIFGDFNQSTSIASRGDASNDGGPLAYTAYASLPAQQQMNYKPIVSRKVREYYQTSRYLAKAQRLPKGLKRVEQITQSVIEKETVRRQRAEGRESPRELTPLEIANALESHLRDSGEYKYSLDLSIVDSTIDPVEDFLINRKAGHCEYFATALTLMLRAAKIPARIVSGYKGGVGRQNGETLEVQQRFAHLWSEAWLDEEGWTTLDATPVDARSLSIAAVSSRPGSLWSGMQTTLSGLWNENVLNMSLDRQEESIYKPIREIAFSVGTFLRQLFTSPGSAIQSFWDLLRNREQWFSIGGGLFAFALISFMAGTVWLVVRIVRWIRWFLGNRRLQRAGQRRRIVEFYERFVRIAKDRGMTRSSSQTQREFAEQVASAYSPELLADNLFGSPGEISRLFYRVRFGDEQLSAGDEQELDHVLTRLEKTLSNDSSPAMKKS